MQLIRLTFKDASVFGVIVNKVTLCSGLQEVVAES